MKSTSTNPRPRPYEQTLRAQAAEATAQRILDAFIALLMQHWFDEITLDRVALDAGVTVQTVVRRFGGKDGLLAAAAPVLGNQIHARRAAPAPGDDRPLKNLVNDYEQIGDPILRMLALEPRHPALKTLLDFGRSEHRAWVAAAFAATLDPLTPALREKTLDQLVIATDVYTWKLLRRDMHRSLPATLTAMTAMVHGVLEHARTLS
jgi:AcrR family transcriptional regulator